MAAAMVPPHGGLPSMAISGLPAGGAPTMPTPVADGGFVRSKEAHPLSGTEIQYVVVEVASADSGTAQFWLASYADLLWHFALFGTFFAPQWPLMPDSLAAPAAAPGPAGDAAASGLSHRCSHDVKENPLEAPKASGDNHAPDQAAADPAELHEPSCAATPCRRQRTPPKCTDRSLAQKLPFVPTGPQFGFTMLACRNDDMSLPLPHDAAACESQRIAAPAVPCFDDVIAEHVAIMRQASFGEFYQISSLTMRNLPVREDTWRVGLSVCHHARCSNTDVVVHPRTPKPLDIGRVLAKCGGSADEETRITVLIGLRSRVAVIAYGLHTPSVGSFIRISVALHKAAFQHSGSGLLIDAWSYYKPDVVDLRQPRYSFTALCLYCDQDFSCQIEFANKFRLCSPCEILLCEVEDKDDYNGEHFPEDDEDDDDGSSMCASDVPGLDPWY
ncbi:unnamed protein product [Polarella glacialis]|uniref:Uncharacterized protein n=1 Tax=Polarella glacialis TaxID=89957 RepID=A0A813EIE7_POLGL|nr:unnamed protein product [Polarella glacialis]